MKRKSLLLLLLALLPLAASAGNSGSRTVPKTQINAMISEFRRYDGVETVRLGRLGTAAVKGVLRMAAQNEPDAREALALTRGVKHLAVLEYDDCRPEVRERITRRLSEALDGSELLMEARDGSSSMRMFGIVDEQTGEVRDFVLHAPQDCALICIFGSIPMDTVGKLLSDD
ncbi:MAG: hypothetical protein K5849_04025 [Bacteroidales bacterium]|nr:hypothetical protein [Bacteroidales bacterium]